MNTCPHCQQRGVPSFKARFSDPSWAVSCRLCQRPSHRAAGDASSVLTILLGFASIMAGIMTGSWLVGLTGMAVVLAYNVWAWQRLELLPLSAERAKSAERTSMVVFAAWVLSLFLR